MDDYAVNPAVPQDAGALLEMIRGLARYERHACVATEADLVDALFGIHPVAEALIARAAGVATGFAVFFHHFSTFQGRRGIWLEDLFVVPEHRRRGCGRALLARVARIALERGCGRLHWAVLDWNASAIAFYEALGATVMPDWRIVRVAGDGLAAFAARASPDGKSAAGR